MSLFMGNTKKQGKLEKAVELIKKLAIKPLLC